MKLYFNGRSDGLGNRLEELIKLEIYCEIFDKKIIYRWNNSDPRFNYPIFFECKNIEIIETEKKFMNNPFDKSVLWRDYVSKIREQFNAKNIKFNFDDIEMQHIDLGIHIRARDRIVKNIDNIKSFSGYSTFEQLDKIVSKTLSYINKNFLNKTIFLATDDKEIENYFLSKLNENITIYNPLTDGVNSETFYNKKILVRGLENGTIGSQEDLVDFYILSQCKEIMMSSHYSTFPITLALMRGVNLYGFNDEYSSDLYRFNTSYINLGENNIQKLEDMKEYSPYKFNDYLNIGADFKENFMVEKESVFNTEVLISISNSEYYSFEEHFKILFNKMTVIVNKNFSFSKLVNSILNFSKDNKSFKRTIKDWIRYFKVLKLFSYNDFDKSISKIEKILDNNDNIFLKLDIEMTNTTKVNKLVEEYSHKFSGLIIQTRNFQQSKQTIDKIIENSKLNLCYLSVNNSNEQPETSCYFVFTSAEHFDEKFVQLPLRSEVPRNHSNKRIALSF